MSESDGVGTKQRAKQVVVGSMVGAAVGCVAFGRLDMLILTPAVGLVALFLVVAYELLSDLLGGVENGV